MKRKFKPYEGIPFRSALRPNPDVFLILLIRLPSCQVRENRQAPPVASVPVEYSGSSHGGRAARFPPKFTPSTQLSRPGQAAGRALPLSDILTSFCPKSR